MATAQAHSDFLPPPSPGSARALVLALIVHGLLVLALAYVVPWHLQTPTATFSAELWAPLPMEAAPPALPPEPPTPEVESIVPPRTPAPAPPPEPARVATPPSPAINPDIATAERKAQQKKQDERDKVVQDKKKLEERRLANKREMEQRKEEALKVEKQKAEALAQEAKKAEKSKLSKAEDAKRRKELEAAKAEEAKRLQEIEAAKAADEKRLKDLEIAKQQEADRLREEQAQSDKLRKDARERALKLAGAAAATGSGSANATGNAAQSAGPSASYGAKVVAAIRPNISTIKELSASLTAEYDVYTDASGKIMSARIRKRSGDAYWDDAALNAILKTERLPLDENGRVPSPMTISLRPRD
jgi:colicin import membrane protein